MTKEEVKSKLMSGARLDEILDFGWGMDCPIFKARCFSVDDVIYVPDTWLNELETAKDISQDPEAVEAVLSCCYTGADFLQMCEEHFGTADADEKAKGLFAIVNWQHPSTELDCCEDVL